MIAETILSLAILCQIESGCQDDAVSFLGAKYGRGAHQISEIALKHYNEVHDENLLPDDLFFPEVNYGVADWYRKYIASYALRHYPKAGLIDAVFCWNAGIGAWRKWHESGRNEKRIPEETRNFIRRYRTLLKEKLNANKLRS